MGLLDCCSSRAASSAIAPEPNKKPRKSSRDEEEEEEEDDDRDYHPGKLSGKIVASREPTFQPSAFQHLQGLPSSRSARRRASIDGDRTSTRDRTVSGQTSPSAHSMASPTKGLFGMDWSWLPRAKVARNQSSKHDASEKGKREGGRGGAAEALQRRGFVTHLAKDIHKSVSTATTKPIAVLGMEPATDERGGEVALQQSDPAVRHGGETRRNHNKLFPLYINGVAKSYFKISHSRDYAQVLRRLLRRDPLLTFALQKAIKSLTSGDNKPVSHVTSDPTGATASLYGLRITPCVWADSNGHKVPALLLEHNVAYDPQDVMPRLLRDYAVLSHVPSILTLIDFNGHVLYQNAASIDYAGDLTSHNVETGDGVLGVLFQYEPQMLQEMLQEVNEGNYWQQVVRVPGSLKRHLAFESEHASTVSRVARDKRLRAAVSKRFLQDDLEPEFQLESFTTQEARSQRNNPAATRGMGPLFQNPASLLRSDSGMHRPSGTGTQPGQGSMPPKTDSDGVLLSGPVALAGRQGSVSGAIGQLRLGSNTVPNGTNHVAFSLPNAPPVGGEDSNLSNLRHTSLPAVGQTSFSSTPNAKAPGSTGPNTGQAPTAHNRRFMTLMQSAQAQQAQQSFTTSIASYQTGEGTDKPDSRQAAMEECWHDISAIPLLDPVLDKQVILLLQTNVTARVELENRLADLTDAQLGMLEQLFPRHVIEYMLSHKHGYNSRNLTHLAEHHDDVIVLFTDVVGFTNMSKEVEPSEVMHFLNELYTIFDDLVDLHDLYKLDTVGDCYIVVAGLTMQDDDGFTCTVQGGHDARVQNAQTMMEFAKAMLRESRRVTMPHNRQAVQIRIGIHIGSLASGLVGPKMPKFTLFGDTMNTASRMESTCKPGCIQVSSTFSALLPLEDWQDTGGVEVKGKGLMQTYLWLPKAEDVLGFKAEGDGDTDDDNARLAAKAASALGRGPTEPGMGSPLKSSLARTKSLRASSVSRHIGRARPKTGKASERASATGAPMGRSADGAGPSRPSTAGSQGAVAGQSRLARSLSRRGNMSMRRSLVPPGGSDDDDEGQGIGMAPFLTILNAIRGSATGESDDDLVDGKAEGMPATRLSATGNPRVSDQGELQAGPGASSIKRKSSTVAGPTAASSPLPAAPAAPGSASGSPALLAAASSPYSHPDTAHARGSPLPPPPAAERSGASMVNDLDGLLAEVTQAGTASILKKSK